MKILILGANGNLGCQLKKVFNNEEVIALDKEQIDITDKDSVLKKINEIKPDVIINAAAYNAVDRCEDAEGYKLAEKLNGLAPGYLAEAAAENNAILIHYSSDYVFDGDNKEGYKENDKPEPVSKYGETKLMGENEILKYKNKDLKYYIIRTSKLFGPKGESEVSKDSFFDIMIKLAKEKEEIDVVDEEMSCFTYTPDLAKATKDLLDNKKACPERSRREYGIYHIINSGPCTWFEAAKELFNIAGVDIRVNPVTSDKFPRPAKRPKYSVLLNTKLKSLRSYKEALEEYLNNL